MTLANEAYERFAQSRFAGQTLAEAYQAAGLFSVASAKEDAAASLKFAASHLARQPEVQERIAELYRERAAEIAYDKASAMRDLLAIIHTSPADAEEGGAEHPLCEVRMGKDGTYHRFPPKLQAMARLIKLMGWDQMPEPEPEADEERRDTLRDWIAAERSGKFRGTMNECDADSADRPTDVDSVIARLKKRLYGPDSTVQRLNVSTESTPSSSQTAANHSQPSPTAPSGYTKDDAVRDLVAIVHARPIDAGPDHPLCEARMTSWGKYHRFPSKLAAITLLARICGWVAVATRRAEAEAARPPYDPDAKLRAFLVGVRERQEEAKSERRSGRALGQSE
jgi:hypothetical protein